MATVATMVALLAGAGAIASWVAGAICYARARDALGGAAPWSKWLGALVWPFANAKVKAAAGTSLNKALIALFACLMVGVAATSVATNLHRIPR